jgi:TRAP-type C4-dicarboxylate transport system permease small subunit
MVGIITVDVIGRGLFSFTTLIADSSSGYSLVGLAFLALACTEASDKHVVVGILTRRLPPAIREPLEVAIFVFTLLFTIWLTWIFFQATRMNYVSNTISLDPLHIHVWITYSVGPLGTGMFAIVLLTKLIRKAKIRMKAEDIN